MTTSTTSTADRIAMLVGGGLIVVGVIVLGFLNTITNSPHLEVVEDGTVVAEPLIPPDLRAYLVLAGLLVWLLFGLYKVTATPAGELGAAPSPAS
ncbi:MAG: hypothetical protein ACLFMX_02885 [Halobacteriales archaeon]